MHVEFIIVGQGISGTFLSYYLSKEKRSFIVVDKNDHNSPSRIAAGIINPVTGRRMVTVWMAEEILPFAWNAYQEVGRNLDVVAISQKNTIDFFPNPFMRENFLKRLDEGNEFIHMPVDPEQFEGYFNYDFGCGEIQPVYTAHLEILLPAWKNKLKEKNLLVETNFDPAQLFVDGHSVQWTGKDEEPIYADKIIFCDGAGSFHNPYFSQLPFAPNKGEALIAEIPGLSSNHVYKKSITIVPLSHPGLFWIGSNYLWEFDNIEPSMSFQKSTVAALKEWLKLPFKIVDHRVGIRPATLERRPFVGLHPAYPSIGILNGMGTKGCSLAPFFARQLTDHLVHGKSITPGADVNRFSKILMR